MLKRSCEDCLRWMWDEETGRVREYPPGSGIPLIRPPTSPTPCEICPKCAWSREKSPQVGRRATLSRKNQLTLDVYQEVQATFGRLLGPRALADGMLMRNLGIIAELYELHRRAAQTRVEELLARLMKTKSR